MSSSDLVLLHAPHVYDFRNKTILYGPVSDLVPATPVFEMYPFGLTSIADYLERYGYRVRIVNLAGRMLRDKNFNAEKFIKKLRAGVFGIDLHWLVHAHGAVEIARLVKKYHPESKVVMGGFSASYFYRDLLNYPEIDYVLRGDSTEEPLRRLLETINEGQSLQAVPNLIWKDSSGNINENHFSHIPDDIGNVMVDHYGGIIRSVIRHRDLASIIPFKDWLRYPVTAVFTCRGCNHNCVICGGSNTAFRTFLNRQKTVFRSSQDIARDIRSISRFSRGPIFILGDIHQLGDEHAGELLDILAYQKVKNRLMLEVFNPPSMDFLQKLSQAADGFCLEVSPESHDPAIRKAAGKNFSNEEMEQMIADTLAVGCGRVDIFFMVGIPNQTPQSVMETIDYCQHLLEKFGGDKRITLLIGPLAPFLDPGSMAFEHPQKYGYRVLLNTLEEHRQALLAPSWRYTLNYETEWMNRHQIMDTTYEAILRLTRLKAEYGLISKKVAEKQVGRINTALELEKRIGELWCTGNHQEIELFKPQVDRINAVRANERDELELSVGSGKLRYLSSLWSLLYKRS
ncbi:MAG: TIGR04190 family B12-binding domain/radical SAM domain protein [Dehalococcoidia bacterium]|nr:MAG: TIGR04190 family B12-binding domain/radical SAM domain protein [Dehalococcoidia bacterium]